MLKYQFGLRNCHLQASRGATIQRFFKFIVGPDKRWAVSDFNVVMLHVGTNNLYINTSGEFGCYMEQLVGRILWLNPDATIVLTSLIPRPADSETTRPKAKMYNFELMRLADQRVGPRFIGTHIMPGVNVFYVNIANCLIDSHGNVKSEMFTRADQLHLSAQGNRTMQFKLRSVMNNFRYNRISRYYNNLPTAMILKYTRECKVVAFNHYK